MSKEFPKEYLAIIVVLLLINLFAVTYMVFGNNHKQQATTSTTDTTVELKNTEPNNEEGIVTPTIPTYQNKEEDKITNNDSSITITDKSIKQNQKIDFVIITKSPYASNDGWQVYGSVVVPKDTRVIKSNNDITFLYKNYRLKIAGNDDMNDSVFKPYAVLPGYKKIGIIKLLTADDKGYIPSDLYRVAYQTDQNIFYTNNFENNKNCEVANYSETPPCAWLTISFSTKTFIWATLDCGAEQPSQECLNWGDNIIKTLEIRH